MELRSFKLKWNLLYLALQCKLLIVVWHINTTTKLRRHARHIRIVITKAEDLVLRYCIQWSCRMYC